MHWALLRAAHQKIQYENKGMVMVWLFQEARTYFQWGGLDPLTVWRTSRRTSWTDGWTRVVLVELRKPLILLLTRPLYTADYYLTRESTERHRNIYTKKKKE